MIDPDNVVVINMRTIYQSSYEKTHADVFEDRISEIKFAAFQGNFDTWTEQILSMFRSRSPNTKPLTLEMGDLCIKESPTHPAPPSRIFRVKEPDGLFWYVDVLPITKQFMFIADKKHTTAISPDEGIARLIHKQTGLDTRSMVSDTVGMITVKVGDTVVTTVDTRTQEDRERAAKEELKRWKNDDMEADR